MVQVWKIDSNNFYTCESYFTEKPSGNEIIIPITIGYIKPKWNGLEWVEGATREELQEWKDGLVTEIELPFEESQLEYNLDLDYRLSLIEMGLM